MVEDLKAAFTKWVDNVELAMTAAGTSIDKFGEDMTKAAYGEDGESGIVKSSEDIAKGVDDIAKAMEDTFNDKALSEFANFAAEYAASMVPMIEANKTLIS
jgi:hypothetical protein